MVKAKTKKKPAKTIQQETDGAYVLKLALYLILGSQWVWLINGDSTQIPLPLGLVIGLLFASHDHFQVDRKIEYAFLLIAMMIGFWAQIGVFVTL